MADSKISALTALTETPADDDVFAVVDTSATATKKITFATLNAAVSATVAADDIGIGNAAVSIATSAGNITIDAQAGDTDIIFKGTDNTSDITALTLDMSEAGAATFNDKITAVGTSVFTNLDISGDVDVDGTTNLDVVDIDGAVNVAADVTIASTNKIIFNDASQFIQGASNTILDIAATDEIELTATLIEIVGNSTVSGTLGVTGVLTGTSLDISGDIDIDGTSNLDIVDIDGAVDMATTLTLGGNADFNGDLDVDGTTNLDVVDIDGAVDMASTLTVAEAINGALKRWAIKTSAYTAVAGDRLLADTATTAAFTVTLPSSPSVGDEIHILDGAANFDSANLTVGRNGKKIQGATADLTLTTQNTGIGLVFLNDTYGWRVLVDAYDVDTTEL